VIVLQARKQLDQEVEMSIATRRDQVLPAGAWKLDAVHSHASYAVKHTGAPLFRGGVDGFDADLIPR